MLTLALLAGPYAARAQKGAAPAAGPGGPGLCLASFSASRTTICQGGSSVLSYSPDPCATGVTYSYAWSPNQDLTATNTPSVVVNPLTTTTYTLTVTPSTGPVQTLTRTVTVQANCCQYPGPSANVVELQADYDDFGGNSNTTPTDPFYGQKPGTYFHVAGKLTLRNGNFIMPEGGVLLMEANADILLLDAKLDLVGCTVTAACDAMWGALRPNDDGYGLAARPVGTLRPRVMHSQGGVAMDGNNSPGLMRMQLNRVQFLHNYRSLQLNFVPSAAAGTDFVTDCAFDSDPAQLKAPYQATATDNWYAQEHVTLVGDARALDFSGNGFKHALVGINLLDTGPLPPALVVRSCGFSNVYLAGISSGHATVTATAGPYSLRVETCQFTFPTDAALPATTQVSQTMAANPATLRANETVGVGAQNVPLTVQNCVFSQVDASPYATFNYTAYRPRQIGVASTQLGQAFDNTFQNLAVGLADANNAGQSADVQRNLFSACEKGLSLAGASGNVYASCNSFLRGVSASARGGVSYGIYAEAGSLLTLSDPSAIPGGAPTVLKNFFDDNLAGISGYYEVVG